MAIVIVGTQTVRAEYVRHLRTHTSNYPGGASIDRDVWRTEDGRVLECTSPSNDGRVPPCGVFVDRQVYTVTIEPFRGDKRSYAVAGHTDIEAKRAARLLYFEDLGAIGDVEKMTVARASICRVRATLGLPSH